MLRLKFVKDDTKIDFMGMHKIAFAVSIAMMIFTVFLLGTKGLNLGIDFTGGLMMEVRMPAEMGVSDVRDALTALDTGKPVIQEFGKHDIMIKIPGTEVNTEAQRALTAQVADLLGEGVKFRRTEYVGPQVGGELLVAGFKAFIFSMLGIMAYIWMRFDWQFGLTGLVALSHDVLATILFFILTGIEFDLSTVAAVLLVAGYSINDTVVIFDRIREMMRKYRKKPLAEIFNMSINQMLSRTLMTSILTLVALVALSVFGTENIRGFTLALLVGVAVGTYSSVFIATAQLLYLNIRPKAVVAAEAEVVEEGA